MEESTLILQAKSKINAVKNQKLSMEERKDRAIDLAAGMLEEAMRIQTKEEKKQQAQLAAMMRDPIGKIFTTMITDQCFRSNRPKRIADQLTYLIKHLGIPNSLPRSKSLALQIFETFGKTFPNMAVPLTIRMLRKETSRVILPEEAKPLIEHMKKRYQEGVRINLNHLGEAILGEEEAQRRLQIYLEDLAKPEVEYISVKISTLFSQIQLLSWEETLNTLAERLRQLYRAAIKYHYRRPDGLAVQKFVNLDMEEYRDLHLTVAVFKQVLDEPEFYRYEGGIVLQSYLPESFIIQQELTLWAMQRRLRGGASIKIRLVKGANLAMEQLEAALRLWPQAPYLCKSDVDANFKRMALYGCQKEHAQAAHLGIGTHNLFDIAFVLLLRSENNVEKEISFEMLEGMADHLSRVVQQIAGDLLLYCPTATNEEFQNAIAYLVRRLDENTAPENFLRHMFDLKPGTDIWNQQTKRFSDACFASTHLPFFPRRTQNRDKEKIPSSPRNAFDNEPDTDWSLPQNRRWAEKIVKEGGLPKRIPLIVGEKEINLSDPTGIGEDPSFP